MQKKRNENKIQTFNEHDLDLASGTFTIKNTPIWFNLANFKLE